MAEGEQKPPQGFTLNDWKAQFQNNKTKPAIALEWLWKNYDAANWSFWTIEYKYNDEIKQSFMASNAIKGLVQRWENARKVAFGIFSILKGTETPFMQCGCLLTKGTEVPAEIAVEGKDDYELYVWTKLDPVNKPADKEIIESFFSFGDDVTFKGAKRDHIDGLKFL
jgi:elongation factor 1-gamma